MIDVGCRRRIRALFANPREGKVTAEQADNDQEEEKRESCGPDRSGAVARLLPSGAFLRQLDFEQFGELVNIALGGRCFGTSRHFISKNPQVSCRISTRLRLRASSAQDRHLRQRVGFLASSLLSKKACTPRFSRKSSSAPSPV